MGYPYDATPALRGPTLHPPLSTLHSHPPPPLPLPPPLASATNPPHHRLPAPPHPPAISHRGRHRSRVRPRRVRAPLRRRAHSSPRGMRRIAARRAEIGSHHHVPRRARDAGHADHPPEQRIHSDGREGPGRRLL